MLHSLKRATVFPLDVQMLSLVRIRACEFLLSALVSSIVMILAFAHTHSALKIGVRGTFVLSLAKLNMVVLALKSFFIFKYTSCLALT